MHTVKVGTIIHKHLRGPDVKKEGSKSFWLSWVYLIFYGVDAYFSSGWGINYFSFASAPTSVCELVPYLQKQLLKQRGIHGYLCNGLKYKDFLKVEQQFQHLGLRALKPNKTVEKLSHHFCI